MTATARHRSGAALLGGGAVALVLALSGCGATQSAPSAGGAFNRADVQFAQTMIPRQQQAYAMSALAMTHSSDPAVVALAARIRGDQGSWTKDMSGCLTRWDHTRPSGMMSPSGKNGMMGSGDAKGMMGSTGRNGMMSRAGLRGLASKHGASFDAMFLKMMVRHHVATLSLAKGEGASGTSPAAKKLAEKVQMMQGPELRRMRRLMQP
ncbi:MAG: DUF305 domain-containing protein [Nocardioidaceae bacterium]